MKKYKKLFVIMFSFLIVFTLSACNSSTNDTNSNNTTDEKGNSTLSNSSKVLVAYFSCTGTTESVAKYIADELNAKLYEIEPEEPYTSEDLDYGNSNSRTSSEQNSESSRPAISISVSNMNEYDVVFIGYPIWWGQAPKIISTFLESYDFSGKTIVPFCTSHSSSIGSSDTNLHKLCSSSTKWISGNRFASNTSKEEIVDWLNNIQLTDNAK